MACFEVEGIPIEVERWVGLNPLAVVMLADRIRAEVEFDEAGDVLCGGERFSLGRYICLLGGDNRLVEVSADEFDARFVPADADARDRMGWWQHCLDLHLDSML